MTERCDCGLTYQASRSVRVADYGDAYHQIAWTRERTTKAAVLRHWARMKREDWAYHVDTCGFGESDGPLPEEGDASFDVASFAAPPSDGWDEWGGECATSVEPGTPDQSAAVIGLNPPRNTLSGVSVPQPPQPGSQKGQGLPAAPGCPQTPASPLELPKSVQAPERAAGASVAGLAHCQAPCDPRPHGRLLRARGLRWVRPDRNGLDRGQRTPRWVDESRRRGLLPRVRGPPNHGRK